MVNLLIIIAAVSPDQYILVSLSAGFLLPNITLDAATYQACSTCDARADRAGNLAVAEALKEFMTK